MQNIMNQYICFIALWCLIMNTYIVFSCSKLPLSTIRPLFITRIRSATLEITPKSWVMKSMAVFLFFLIRMNYSRISY